MNAIVVDEYGDVTKLVAKPQGHDILVRQVDYDSLAKRSKGEFENVETQIERVRACSVNLVDTKVRRGVYDDYPDYYERVHIHTRSSASMARARSRMSNQMSLASRQ
jgi:hypothetical protein